MTDLQMALLNIQSLYETRIITLKSTDSGELTLGIGKHYGFVEFVNSNGEPPYLISVDKKFKGVDFLEFDSGGTQTPIPSNNCLPMGKVFKIVEYFFQHEELIKDIKWEEI